ncbi:MAG: ComF family protein [Hydrogenovibrio sp.]|nr:ComF family protein [Hydrogenovibrio sp.]
MRLLPKLEHWLFPPIGRKALANFNATDLSDEIYKQLILLEQSCPVCAEPTVSGRVCGQCLADAPAYDRTQAILHLNAPLTSLIHDYKYGQQLFYSRLFAEIMASHLKTEGVQAMIPIPLSRQRLLSRGFNQSLELAKSLSKRMGIPVMEETLSRVKDTPPQASMNARQRQRNLKHAFQVEPQSLAGVKRVTLIDDVMTTGATLHQAARALKLHCPDMEVQAWVIARAVKD